MPKTYGTGVSRVLDPAQAQLLNVIFQQGRPPLDSEFTLMQDISQESLRSSVALGTPSGWLGSGTHDGEVFVTNPSWSNWFRFGQQRTGELRTIPWAVVNGWVIPVTATLTGTPPGSPTISDTWNRITLAPPPSNSGDSRIDFVFLEAWQARLPPNPATTNKPASSALYRYGNVEGGYSYLPDDLVDPSIGFETTQRVQLQYRIRVVTGLVGLQSYPDGFDPASVKGRGGAATETAFPFTNMRAALGDPGLWRSGDGTANSLGTVDGYTYAIPLCVLFRRNSVAWDGDPGQNLNGGFNRNSTAIDRSGWKTFSTVPTLAAAMTAGQMTLALSSISNIALPLTPSTPVYIQVGDEIMTYSPITGTTATIVLRGALGTRAEAHAVGSAVRVVTGRPDELFADQIAKTDILDLRHVVNPNGFDTQSLLDGALDQLLRGDLRANWKRSGGGPQGSYVAYQDKISSSAPALGVTKLDSPDGIRQVWSDASYLQPIEFIAKPGANMATTWPLSLSGTSTSGAGFVAGNVLTIPISQFKLTVSSGADGDQIQFPAIALSPTQPVVKMRIAGDSADLIPETDFTVATPTGPTSDLVITLVGAAFAAAGTKALFITFHVQYGAGRGLSHRPDCVHGVDYLSAASGTVLRQRGVPANNTPMSSAWAPLWSKARTAPFAGSLPVTAESYVDPGSKTVILSPFRQIGLPTESVFRAIKSGTPVMPISAKWGAVTDPLNLFSTTADPVPAKQDTYFVLPRNLMPGWGAVHAPIIHTDSGTIHEGINFGFQASKAPLIGANTVNVIPFTGGAGGSKTFATFSTVVLSTFGTTPTPATFNTFQSDATQAAVAAGMRFFIDSRGLGRKGLELPPFYGIARLFAVYEATDWFTRGSAYDNVTRVASDTGAVNLLRQDMGDAPSFWIEMDDYGDSTFILNAEAIDVTKTSYTGSLNVVSTFESGHYVIETSIFGFARGTFDLTKDCRIVLPRDRAVALNPAGADPGAPLPLSGVSMVIPAPPQQADSIAINYSRTPYQGDVWGSQNGGQDIPQLVGPLTSATANQIGFTEINEATLTRPNQKVLEVIASKGFMTTYGTGRIAGDYSSASSLNFRGAGYENVSTWPPINAVDPRPTSGWGALTASDEALAIGTTYHGCIERLPLGALFRSKDFRGEAIDAGAGLVGLLFREPSKGQVTNVARSTLLEQKSAPVFSSAPGGGGPGEILVHVDGESGNMGALTNYRTTRGGSAFVASGPYPGGELAGAFSRIAPGTIQNATLVGIAYLVRNSVTNIGTEVSAGGELMLLVVTTAIRKHHSATIAASVLCGTQGSGEGFSAADLYRITGRPLANDGVKIFLDPATIVLGRKVTLKPRIGG